MIEYIEEIRKSPLFEGLNLDETVSLLEIIDGNTSSYKKSETILSRGKVINKFGLILSGAAMVVKDNYWGNRNVINALTVGDIFAESFALTKTETTVSVLAYCDAVILWISIDNLLITPLDPLNCKQKFIANLLKELSMKNLFMNEKLSVLNERTTKEKILSYLTNESQKRGKKQLEIPFNRQQLADYLLVERSALSKELSVLKSDGLIDFKKNKFELK